jgi:hypothetical protein
MKKRRLCASALEAGTLVLAGCGGDPEGGRLVPVHGTIVYNGKPLANANVAFIPGARNRASTPASAFTGAEGGYQLRHNNRLGVAPGHYDVRITPPLSDGLKEDPDAVLKHFRRSKAGTSAAKIKSEYEVEVGADGGRFDFDLSAATSASARK